MDKTNPATDYMDAITKGERDRAEADRLRAVNAKLVAALDKHLPESLGSRADGEKECHYCSQLVSLDPHAPDCPSAAIEEATK